MDDKPLTDNELLIAAVRQYLAQNTNEGTRAAADVLAEAARRGIVVTGPSTSCTVTIDMDDDK